MEKTKLLLAFCLASCLGFAQLQVNLVNYETSPSGVSCAVPPYINNPLPICKGGSVLLTALVTGGSGSYSYVWSTGVSLPSLTNAYRYISPLNAVGNYPVTVTVTDINVPGLTATGNYIIPVINSSGIPIANLSTSSACPSLVRGGQDYITINAINPASPGNSQLLNNATTINLPASSSGSGVIAGSCLNSAIPILSTPDIITPYTAGTYEYFVATTDNTFTCQNFNRLILTVKNYTSCGAGLPSISGTINSAPTATHFLVSADLYINGNVTFNGKVVDMAPGVSIFVNSGSTFILNGSWLRACPLSGCMWNGIYVKGNAKLISQKASVIEDAGTAILTDVNGAPTLNISQTLFNKNNNNIWIADNIHNLNPLVNINYNVFTCRTTNSNSIYNSVTNFNTLYANFETGYNNINALYPVTTTNYGLQSYSGIYVKSYTNPVGIAIGSIFLTPGYNTANIFDYLQFGIWALSTDKHARA